MAGCSFIWTTRACRNVLDIGRAVEFLEMMRSAGIPAKGIDLSQESVDTCLHKQLDAEVADLFVYLENLPEASLDGIFCSQVVEHLPPERLPEMIRLCATRLQRNGVLAIETPNPECLAIFATHFYLDPTHQRPVPHPLLAFYLEEFGMGNIECGSSPAAVDSLPSVKVLPEDSARRSLAAWTTPFWEETVAEESTFQRRENAEIRQ
jgi:O-antigen chain-terminating methyltransferase